MKPSDKITLWAATIGVVAGGAFHYFTDSNLLVCAIFGVIVYAMAWRQLISDAAVVTVVDAKILQEKAGEK